MLYRISLFHKLHKDPALSSFLFCHLFIMALKHIAQNGCLNTQYYTQQTASFLKSKADVSVVLWRRIPETIKRHYHLCLINLGIQPYLAIREYSQDHSFYCWRSRMDAEQWPGIPTRKAISELFQSYNLYARKQDTAQWSWSRVQQSQTSMWQCYLMSCVIFEPPSMISKMEQ